MTFNQRDLVSKDFFLLLNIIKKVADKKLVMLDSQTDRWIFILYTYRLTTWFIETAPIFYKIYSSNFILDLFLGLERVHGNIIHQVYHTLHLETRDIYSQLTPPRPLSTFKDVGFSSFDWYCVKFTRFSAILPN